MNIEVISFGHDGIIIADLQESDVDVVTKEVYSIKEDFDSHQKATDFLAGNMEHEYKVSKDSIQCLDRILRPLIDEYNKKFTCVRDIMVLENDLPMELVYSWVNFQKKHEFNPAHRHGGVFSFILWIDVPFSYEDEIQSPSIVGSNTKCPGVVEWLYTGTLGRVEGFKLPVDKTYNYKLALFSSAMMHLVYPFYTSDDYRISVSGNYFLTDKYLKNNM